MLRRNVVVAAVAFASIAMLANSTFAQNTQRRERLRKAAETGVAIGAEVAENAADGDGSAIGIFNGHAIIKRVVQHEGAKPADQSQATEINVGGLLILQVDDTGSRPTKFKKATIEPEGAFQRLGRVKGIRTNEEGEDMMGGGYAWLLLKPAKAGEATITIKYTPNGGDGKEVTWTGKINVVEQEK
jgi:hypothetical protein